MDLWGFESFLTVLKAAPGAPLLVPAAKGGGAQAGSVKVPSDPKQTSAKPTSNKSASTQASTVSDEYVAAQAGHQEVIGGKKSQTTAKSSEKISPKSASGSEEHPSTIPFGSRSSNALGKGLVASRTHSSAVGRLVGYVLLPFRYIAGGVATVLKKPASSAPQVFKTFSHQSTSAKPVGASLRFLSNPISTHPVTAMRSLIAGQAHVTTVLRQSQGASSVLAASSAPIFLADVGLSSPILASLFSAELPEPSGAQASLQQSPSQKLPNQLPQVQRFEVVTTRHADNETHPVSRSLPGKVAFARQTLTSLSQKPAENAASTRVTPTYSDVSVMVARAVEKAEAAIIAAPVAVPQVVRMLSSTPNIGVQNPVLSSPSTRVPGIALLNHVTANLAFLPAEVSIVVQTTLQEVALLPASGSLVRFVTTNQKVMHMISQLLTLGKEDLKAATPVLAKLIFHPLQKVREAVVRFFRELSQKYPELVNEAADYLQILGRRKTESVDVRVEAIRVALDLGERQGRSRDEQQQTLNNMDFVPLVRGLLKGKGSLMKGIELLNQTLGLLDPKVAAPLFEEAFGRAVDTTNSEVLGGLVELMVQNPRMVSRDHWLKILSKQDVSLTAAFEAFHQRGFSRAA